MLLVLGRRLANIIPTTLAVVALVFLLFSVLPGSFISGMNEDGRLTIDPAVMERTQADSLDDPLVERFAKYKPVNSQKDVEKILQGYNGNVQVKYVDEYRITTRGFKMP